MKRFASILLMLGGVLVAASSFGASALWEGIAGVMPEEISPPWKRMASGNALSYRALDGNTAAAFLVTTQAVDNVFYEQGGTRLQMTNQLVIEAVLRITNGASAAANRGIAGITFTTEPNVGGAVWFGLNELFVTAAGDVRGGSTNVDTAGDFRGYQITVNGTSAGSSFNVYYNGMLVLTGALYNSPTTFGAQPRIQWGEISSSAYGESRWRYFSHNAAAPTVVVTNPAELLVCTNLSPVTVPAVSGPFMNLTSEGRITNGTSLRYANLGLIFNTDDGNIYEGTGAGYSVMDSGPRRTFTQSDGSQIMLFEFTDLTFQNIGVRVIGSRPAAILATGEIRLVNAHIVVDAGGDVGALAGTEHDAGTDAPAPLGGGGGRGVASAYNAGEPPFLVPGKLPTSGPGGGGFVTPGTSGYMAEPVRFWRYDGSPTFGFTLLGVLHRPGGEGGGTYSDFSVLRGGGAGGSSSGTGFAGNSGWLGGHGGGALFLSTPGRIHLDSRSFISVDGQTMIGYLSEIAGAGAGGYLVLNAASGILNEGSLSARGGVGRKIPYGNPPAAWWGSSGDGGGGLIVLKSAAGVTNGGALSITGGSGLICTLGAVQAQTPSFVNLPPRLLNPSRAGDLFAFNFNTVTNQTYDVQRNDDLNTTNWVTFTNIAGAGLPVSVISPTPGVTNRFFRIKMK